MDIQLNLNMDSFTKNSIMLEKEILKILNSKRDIDIMVNLASAGIHLVRSKRLRGESAMQ